MLVDVQTTSGVSLAKVVQENNNTYTIMYMSPKNKIFYDYEPECEVEKECISGFYNEDDTEETAGFKKVEGGYILIDDSDDDYEPSESDSESEYGSLVESDSESDS